MSFTDTLARALKRTDSWVNTLTGVGLNHRKTEIEMRAAATDYLDDATLEVLYDLDGLAARIVRAVPHHALREGFEVTTGDAALDTAMKARLDELDASGRLRLAWTWARLYGGGVVFVGADDGRDPRAPLDLANIRSVRFLVDVDRCDLTPQSWCNNPLSPRFGQPETYQLLQQGGTASQSTLVHASRLVRFDGAEVTRRRRQHLQGWGDSVLQRVYAELQQLRGAHAAVAALLHESSQGVFKMKDLAASIGADKDDTLKTRLELMDMSRSIARAILIDAEGESFERTEVGTMAGMVEVMDRFVNLLAAVTGIPVTVLMGQAPAGLNATGESDIRSWYDEVAAEREAMLRPKVERVVRLVMLAKDGPTGGVEPASWKVTFPPLYQMTPAQGADVRNKQATTDATYIERGVLTAQEVRASRFKPDGWSDATSLQSSGSVAALDPSVAADVLAKVAAREIPRDAGVALLVSSLGMTAERAEAVMGETGKSFFTAPESTHAAEMDALKAQNKNLVASHRATRGLLARVIERNKKGELVVGNIIARDPTATEEGDTLEEGDVVAVPADTKTDAADDPDVVLVLPAPSLSETAYAVLGVPAATAHELHLTLAYLGKRSALNDAAFERARDALRRWAAKQPPMEATINGLGRFVGETEDPVYFSPDAPELADARERLVRALVDVERIALPTEHGFVPHITLAHLKKGAPTPCLSAVTRVTFTEAAIWAGEDRETFPLVGGA